MRAHGCQHVVRVHNNVHESVEQAKERGVTAGRELYAEPDGHRHHAVVYHVER